MKVGLRELVFILLLMAIPVAAWWFVFRPQNLRNTETMKQIEAKQAKLRELNQATATIGNLKKEISDLENAIEFFRSKLPNEKEIDKVLQEVWRLAEMNQLTTKSIRTVDRPGAQGTFAAADGPHAEQPIAMKLEGDYMGFYSFLLALENQPRIMRIRKMTLKKMDKGPEGSMQAEFVMSVFFERGGKDRPWPVKS
jgi:Tfp pilus assembly protein PilO